MSPQARPGRKGGRVVVVFAALALPVAQAESQASPDSVTIQAGPQYAAGGLHRFLFGTDYRSLWTVPIRVATLDLGAHGGLVPVSQGGGRQTKSLWFRGGDGYMYGFRSVDKDPSVLPEEFEGTFIHGLVSDQTSSQHPFAPSLAVPLMEALGVLHTEPVLVVLPDDSRLGEFRERFAGTLGYFERRATVEPDRPGFAGALGCQNGAARPHARGRRRADVVAFSRRACSTCTWATGTATAGNGPGRDGPTRHPRLGADPRGSRSGVCALRRRAAWPGPPGGAVRAKLR
jgi:hypothetical protein